MSVEDCDSEQLSQGVSGLSISSYRLPGRVGWQLASDGLLFRLELEEEHDYNSLESLQVCLVLYEDKLN